MYKYPTTDVLSSSCDRKWTVDQVMTASSAHIDPAQALNTAEHSTPTGLSHTFLDEEKAASSGPAQTLVVGADVRPLNST